MPESHSFASSPESVGVSSEGLEALFDRVRQEVDSGLLPAVQVAIARQGKIAGMLSYGDASDDSLFAIFSATKAITSAAAWLLIQEGKLDEHEIVASIIPEFGTNGKERITVQQLFTHTAGFPYAPFRPTEWFDRDARMSRFSRWTLNWEPGSKFEYHPTSSMWVIAEIIERKSGMDFADFVRTRIAEPLGLPDMYLGCPDEQHHRILPVVHCGDPMTAADWEKLGMPAPPEGEVNEETLTAFNTPEVRRVPVPGGGGIMGAGEIALFYQGLMHGRVRDGKQVWSPETLKAALAVRTGDLPDLMYGKPVNRALGVVISGDKNRNVRGFGHPNSPEAFGHGGAGGQIAWGDPTTGISIGYCTSGHDRNPMRVGRRGISISNRAAVVGLAT